MNLNTIIKGEKKEIKEKYNYFVKDVREYGDFSESLATHVENFITSIVTTAMQRAYEQSLEDALHSMRETNFLEKIEDEQDNKNSGIEVYRRIRDHLTQLKKEIKK